MLSPVRTRTTTTPTPTEQCRQPRLAWSRDTRWITWTTALAISSSLMVYSDHQFNSFPPVPAGTPQPDAQGGWALLTLTGFVFTVLSAIMVIAGVRWRVVGWPRSLALTEAHAAHHNALWNNARLLYSVLVSGKPLQAQHPGPVVLWPGETAHLNMTMHYARHGAAGDGSYNHSTFLYAGRSAAGNGMMIGSLIGNSIARSRAASAAVPAWRWQQTVNVLATNHGIIVNAGASIQRFVWKEITAFYPEPDRWRVVLQFDSHTAPLMLSGDAAPMLCVYAVHRLRGREGLATSPELTALR